MATRKKTVTDEVAKPASRSRAAAAATGTAKPASPKKAAEPKKSAAKKAAADETLGAEPAGSTGAVESGSVAAAAEPAATAKPPSKKAPPAKKAPAKKAAAKKPAVEESAVETPSVEIAAAAEVAPAKPAPKKAAAKKVASKEAPLPEPAPAPPVPPAFPRTNYAVVEKILVSFLAIETRKVGVGRAVLGLSGGVDSAVSAALAARALGAGNVLGVMMPYASSSPESLADAEAVAAAIGIETTCVEITPQVDAYFARFPDASLLRRGNKMARERMTILYDHSAAREALVIGTSNKTELLLGYGTLYGDMASALNPIGDLYKTQVWELARCLGLPASVIEKAPTADLWSGQTDETELGFSYHEVDRLLYRMIDERCTPAELVDLGFDAAFVEKVARSVRSSQFKRRLPVIAKISGRSIDTDFRYSRDWGR